MDDSESLKGPKTIFSFAKKEKKKTFPEFFRYQKPFFNGIGPLKVSAIDLLLLLQVPSKCLLREFDCLHLCLPPSIFFLSFSLDLCVFPVFVSLIISLSPHHFILSLSLRDLILNLSLPHLSKIVTLSFSLRLPRVLLFITFDYFSS